MYMEAFHVRNYRSISSIDLLPCGRFNVLIGKNNSGKSNVLSALDAYFACLSSDLVRLKPPIGSEIDFFHKQTTNPLTIRAVFSLKREERESIITSVAEERPQLRNALESVEPDLRLSITIGIRPAPKRCSFVQDISLVRQGADPSDQTSRTLLRVSDAAATELFDRMTRIERAQATATALGDFIRQFNSDDFQMAKRGREREGGRLPIEFWLRRYTENLAPEIVSLVRSAFENAPSYDTFRQSLSELSSEELAKIESLNQTPLSSKLQTFSGDEDSIPGYIRALITRIARTKVLHFTERRKRIGPEEAKRLLTLKVRRGGTEMLGAIQATVNALLGVKVDAFEGERRDGQTNAELDVDNFLVEVNGSGVREALRLILDTEFTKPEILLVEEPEIHLHPALETSVMRYLKGISAGCQIFITTHSTNFLDTGNFENVFLISKPDSTHVSSLSFAEAEAKLPQELGIRLSSLFMYDRIVFVEGPSDEQIIREFANTLNVNLGQLNAGFISLRGVRNIGHYAAAEIISFLARRQVKLWFFVDRDEANDIHFRRLKDDFGDKARLHLLSRREIENYLLSPSTNIAYLVQRKRSNGDLTFAPPDEAAVTAQFEQCAEESKVAAIWKRVAVTTCRPMLPKDGRRAQPSEIRKVRESAAAVLEQMKSDLDGLIGNLDKICSDASKDVEQRWAREKLFLVPGSDLLDKWYKIYGLRYDKVRDGPAIAALMSRPDIDQEIEGFIAELAQS